MPILKDYDQFQGLHWETGSLRNYLAYKGVAAPHTKHPTDTLNQGNSQRPKI